MPSTFDQQTRSDATIQRCQSLIIETGMLAAIVTPLAAKVYRPQLG